MSEETCSLCPHPFDPHHIIATTDEPLEGGVILCHVPGCKCYATWGVNGALPVSVPDEQELAELRRLFHGGAI